MNTERLPTRLAVIAILSWLVFLAAANYATVLTEAVFSRVANGQPLATLLVHKAGWPVPFCEEVYWRTPSPHITLAFDGRMALFNLTLIVLVQIMLASLVWRRNTISVRDLLAVTAIVAVILTCALSSSSRFGGSVAYYTFLFAFTAPLALAGIRLPAQLIDSVLWLLRSRRRTPTEPTDAWETSAAVVLKSEFTPRSP